MHDVTSERCHKLTTAIRGSTVSASFYRAKLSQAVLQRQTSRPADSPFLDIATAVAHHGLRQVRPRAMPRLKDPFGQVLEQRIAAQWAASCGVIDFAGA